MQHKEHLGLREETIRENQPYHSWWVSSEPTWEPKGFELSIHFPNLGEETGWKGYLPAVELQVWNHSFRAGWFF